MRKSIHSIQAGDILSELRQYDNLYVPCGNADVRLIEDIDSGESVCVWTDGMKILSFVDEKPVTVWRNKSHYETSSKKEKVKEEIPEQMMLL